MNKIPPAMIYMPVFGIILSIILLFNELNRGIMLGMILMLYIWLWIDEVWIFYDNKFYWDLSKLCQDVIKEYGKLHQKYLRLKKNAEKEKLKKARKRTSKKRTAKR